MFENNYMPPNYIICPLIGYKTNMNLPQECCNKHLRRLGLKVVDDSLFNKESKTDFGVSIENVQFSCLDDSLGIIDKTGE